MYSKNKDEYLWAKEKKDENDKERNQTCRTSVR